MRNDTRPAGPDRGKREQITAGAAGAIGAVAALVMILINAPPTAVTVVIGAAAIAAVLVVSIMVTDHAERGSCRDLRTVLGVAGHEADDCDDAFEERASCCCQHRPVTAEFRQPGNNVNDADKLPYLG